MKPMTAAAWMNINAQGVIEHSGGWYWAMEAYAAYRVREALEEAAQSIEKCFHEMRFNEKVHLGLGDVRVSIGKQEEMVDAIRALMPEEK